MFYRGRLEEFKDFFSQEYGVVFCYDVCSVTEGLVHELTQMNDACSLNRQN